MIYLSADSHPSKYSNRDVNPQHFDHEFSVLTITLPSRSSTSSCSLLYLVVVALAVVVFVVVYSLYAHLLNRLKRLSFK